MPCSPNDTTRHAASAPTAQPNATQTMPTQRMPTQTMPTQTTAAQSDPVLVGPKRACALLKVGGAELLALVNSDRLVAYRLGDQIRFRYRDVESLASRRAIAA